MEPPFVDRERVTPPRLLVIAGPVGVGKTTTLHALSELMTERDIPHGAFDVDALKLGAPKPADDRFNHPLLCDNLAAVWPNHVRRGVRWIILSHVLVAQGQFDDYRKACRGAPATVVWLTAPLEVRRQRIAHRDPEGEHLAWELERTADSDGARDGNGLADVVVETGDRRPRAVAEAILEQLDPDPSAGGNGADEAEVPRLLVISGTIAAGKSTVADHVGWLLSERRVAHVVLDVDALSHAWPVPAEDPYAEGLVCESLAALWPLYVARGLRWIVLPRVVETRAQLDRYRGACGCADAVVVRVTAPGSVRRERIRGRDHGWHQEWSLRRTAELDAILDAARLEDFAVGNDGGPPNDAALQILERLDRDLV